MKLFDVLLMTLVSSTAFSGGFTTAAVPTGIDVVSLGTSGFMIYGEFGNPAGCTVNNQVFVRSSHPQYRELYAMAPSAFTTGKRLIAYSGGCEALGWYSGPSTLYNALLDGQSIYVIS